MLLQIQKPTLRAIPTAHLAQTMTLLGLPAQELRQQIETALAENPALELAEKPRCPSCRRKLPPAGICPVCTRPKSQGSDEPIVFISEREDFVPRYRGRNSVEDIPEDMWPAEVEDLSVYVLRQIAPELDECDRPLAAHLLSTLDEDGFLGVPITEVASYHHVDLERVRHVLRIIQKADPLGVGSASPQDALLIQVETLSESGKVPPLTEKAVREGLSLLGRHSYHELARLLGVSARQAGEVAQYIADKLNPYPARAHWGSHRHAASPTQTYRTPDILVTLLNEGQESPLVVEVISPYSGRLRVSSLFRKALPEAPVDKLDEWQADLEKASLLVKCLQQRNNTLVRLMQRLAHIQREYFLHGDASLLPLTRASLAEELGVHESTISRAVSGKSVQKPNGRIVPLSTLFDRSLNVRAVLRDLISDEKKPLTDSELSDMLVDKGFSVARRTVAKYRSMEGILPARYRKPAAAGSA